MELTPLHAPTAKRPLSHSTLNWIHPTHPLLSAQGRVRIRAHFSISDWLLLGSLLQSLLILLLPLRPIYALLPTFSLAAFKIARLCLKLYGVVENPLMRGVRRGRASAVFPGEVGEDAEGERSVRRAVGESVGGEGMCVLLLSNKCNHPLGMFHPKYRELGQHGKAMYMELEQNPAEHGFLGYSDYSSNNSGTQPHSLSVMYFQSVEHVHRWVHGSAAHRRAWEWWDEEQKMGRVDEITIGHEVYGVERGRWENVYVNAKPYDFGATSHAVKAAGGEKLWMCPLMDGSRAMRTSAQRMGDVKA